MRSVWSDEDVSADQPLWRYVRAERFVESIQSSALHFPSAREFEDPFEGATALVPHDWPTDDRYGELEGADKAFADLRRLTKISCWHCADYESDAMWRLYAADRKGVAIRTTTSRLQGALRPFRLAPHYGEEEPFWGRVRYVDLHAVRLRVGMEERFFIKHQAYEWEREFRVVISVRTAEEFGVEVPEAGIDVPIDTAALVESVYLGPALSESERGAISEVCEGVALGPRLVTSTLQGRPRYT